MAYVFLLICMLAPEVLAAQDAMEKYYGYLPEQVLKLSEDERFSKLPMAYQLNEKSIRAVHHYLPVSLASLHYPRAFDDTKNAIRLFQEDLGDEPTGVLSVGQLYLLAQRSEFYLASYTAVAPLAGGSAGDVYELPNLGKYVSLRGQWEIVGDTIAHPTNSVEVICREWQGSCEVRELKVDDHTTYEAFEGSWGSTVHIISEEYEISILDWSDDVVIAKPSSVEGCRTTLWTLDFELKEFSQVARNSGDPASCSEWHLDAPRVAKIEVDNTAINRVRVDRDRSRRQAALSVTYSGYQAHYRAVMKLVEEEL